MDIPTVLRSKAKAAKNRVQQKQEMDKLCNSEIDHEMTTRMVVSFRDYLRNFLKDKTLDKHPAHFGREEKVTLQWVQANQYIYLRDKHASIPIDEQWLHAQNNYVRTLDTESMFNLFGYTNNGDRFVNSYCRGAFDQQQFFAYLEKFNVHGITYFCLFFPALRVATKYGQQTMHLIFAEPPSDMQMQEMLKLLDPHITVSDKYVILVSMARHLSFERFWVSVLELYIDAIEMIIRNAPVTTAPLVLYRGVSTDYYLTKFMLNHRDRIHVANSFVSTSTSITVASDFIDYEGTKCCFIRIYVPPGSKMVYMQGVSYYNHESEFLLGHKSQFYITKSSTESFCKDTYNLKMRVSDLVVVA